MTMIGHNSRISQSIFRSNPESNYTKISNVLLQDKRLSHEARGLLAELLSRPEDWEITVASIVKSGPSGRDKVYRMLKEAEKFGYGLARQDRRMDGAFQKQQYLISDEPRLLIDIAARELLLLESSCEPLPENTEAVVLPFPEKPEAVAAKNGLNQAASWKPVSGQPLPGNPFTAEPFTVNPTHTKERYIQTKDLTKAPARESEAGFGKMVAAVAGALVATALPAAAAPHHPVEQVQQTVAECWQNPKARMDAGLNINEMRAQKQVWQTGTGLLEVTGDFKSELEHTYPLVDLKMGLAVAAAHVQPNLGALRMMLKIRERFAYLQSAAAEKQRRDAAFKKPVASPEDRPAGMPDKLWAEVLAKRAKANS